MSAITFFICDQNSMFHILDISHTMSYMRYDTSLDKFIERTYFRSFHLSSPFLLGPIVIIILVYDFKDSQKKDRLLIIISSLFFIVYVLRLLNVC